MRRPKIGIIGSGFAGTECARKLEKMLSLDDAGLRMVSPSNHELYLPLLLLLLLLPPPHVAAGVLTPQAINESTPPGRGSAVGILGLVAVLVAAVATNPTASSVRGLLVTDGLGSAAADEPRQRPFSRVR